MQNPSFRLLFSIPFLLVFLCLSQKNRPFHLFILQRHKGPISIGIANRLVFIVSLSGTTRN